MNIYNNIPAFAIGSLFGICITFYIYEHKGQYDDNENINDKQKTE
tara:strand:- start:4080 stop:4214 length:135 start_codon:yes stop_codon:yes gene_type:complete